jgi:hypothetical protein
MTFELSNEGSGTRPAPLTDLIGGLRFRA